ncbi:hypothetical protein SLNSH_22025 [Alsobacter soli]|uniref:Uncharacterized protein n=1 Tax=Alsobacter soli TaxID=2109933 RepID=A0A2T1HMC5_9HYPH|nr:hypothetical protein [Alsobacter soli]PSC02804.1 hypothetical protein SLNSH_22025 [Alsobacter soli]
MPALKTQTTTYAAPPAIPANGRARGFTPAPQEPAATEDIARYIAQMTTEMAALARSANLDLLAYFLEMAKIEANVTARRATPA